MEEGIHYEDSYSPTCQGFSFRLSVNVAAIQNMILFFIDASNAFQTNVISDPHKRHYVGLPTLYMEWYRSKWPDHPLLQYSSKELVMQTLRNLQGTKDAGHHWYMLLVKIFKKLGMKPNLVCRGVWHWEFEDVKCILTLATDDMILATTHPRALDILLTEFSKYFEYTTRKGSELSFLNYRIIQSEWGISIDQTTHI